MTTLVDLVSRLDLPAKVRLLTGATTFTLAPEPIVQKWWSQVSQDTRAMNNTGGASSGISA